MHKKVPDLKMARNRRYFSYLFYIFFVMANPRFNARVLSFQKGKLLSLYLKSLDIIGLKTGGSSST